MKNNLNFTSNQDTNYNDSLFGTDWRFTSLFDEMLNKNIIMVYKAKADFVNAASPEDMHFNLFNNY